MAIWVHCRSCGQTYMTVPGDRCSLCREPGTLVDTDPPSPIRELVNRRDRTDGGYTLVVGLLGIFVGAIIGAAISLGFGIGPPVQRNGEAAVVRQAENGKCGLGIVASEFVDFVGGVVVGGAVGGIMSIAALGMIRLATPSYWSDP